MNQISLLALELVGMEMPLPEVGDERGKSGWVEGT